MDEFDEQDALCTHWESLKEQEKALADKRVEVENKLVKLLEVPKEGSKTHKTLNYKTTVNQPVSRKIDVKVWDEVKSNIDEKYHPVKNEVKVDTPKVKMLVEKMPEKWTLIARAFTTKPGKVGIKIEKLDKDG